MYKVFINEKAIFLSETSNLKNLNPDIVTLKYQDKDSIEQAIHTLQNSNIQKIILFHDNLEQLFENFKLSFKYLEAAGGAVLNPNEELLFIFRFNKWDLPKGKIEEGEEPKQAALREVEEECGINNLKIIKALNSTFHLYEQNGELILKKTFWFLMNAPLTAYNLKPQTEEGITKVVWLSKKETYEALNNTYENIKLVVKDAESI